MLGILLEVFAGVSLGFLLGVFWGILGDLWGIYEFFMEQLWGTSWFSEKYFWGVSWGQLWFVGRSLGSHLRVQRD